MSGDVSLDLQPSAGARRHQPSRLSRSGQRRHCRGVTLSAWTACSADGVSRARGENRFALPADGRMRAVTGFGSSP